MKIGVIGAKGLPPKQGGIEHYCGELYPRMVNQGHSVDLFGRCSYTEFSAFEQYDYEGVRVISLPGSGMRGIDAFITSAFGASVARFSNYDLLHFHALGPSLFTWLPKIASSTKIVVTCQGLDWQRDKWGKTSSSLIYMGEQAAVRFADAIIVVSQELQSYFWKTYQRKTIYIPNGPASYSAPNPNFDYGKSLDLEKNRYILFLGRLVPEKCPDLLIQAFQKLQPKGWKLVLVGGNSDTTTYIKQLNDLAGGNPNIIFTGELRGSRLAEIVRGSGLFVLPSAVEGLPLAMLEGMREGIPVLASDIPPHQQLINQDCGLLFQSNDLASCMQQLAFAINQPEKIRKMAQNAQKNVLANYNWDRITDETLKVYNSVLQSTKKVLKSEQVPVDDLV